MSAKLKNIKLKRMASDLKGLTVLSLDEGKLLGKVSKVFISKEKSELSGVLIKDQFWSMVHQYIPVHEIQSIGEDVIYVKSKDSLSKPNDKGPIKDVSIKDLQGHWITTRNGKHLGQFKDAMFSLKSWKVTQVMMSEDRQLEVQNGDITFGSDEILVPGDSPLKVQSNRKPKPSILSRVFSDEPASGNPKTTRKIKSDHRKSKIMIKPQNEGQKKSKAHKKHQTHAQ